MIEMNATALDTAIALFDDDIQTYIRQEKASLLAYAAEERKYESERDRSRDESFE